MLVSTAVSGFIFSKQADGRSPQTIALYRWALDIFVSHIHDRQLDSVTPDDLKCFFLWLQNGYRPTRLNGSTEPLGNRSRELIHTQLHTFFGWAAEELGLKERPERFVKLPRYASKAVVPFTEQEVRAMLKACRIVSVAAADYSNGHGHRDAYRYKPSNAERDAAVIVILLDTGLRVGELCRLRKGDFNLESASIMVNPYHSGLKSRGRPVYLGKAARKALWFYLAGRPDSQPCDYLFATDAGKPLNNSTARRLLRRIADRAGVQGVHPHRFRHTFAVQYLRNGGDVFTLQRLLGHTDLEMTKRYVALANDDSANVHRVASPVDRWAL